MKNFNASVTLAAPILLFATAAAAFQQGHDSAKDASALAQYKALDLTSAPAAATGGGSYRLDPHHTSVTAKLAHMGLSRHTLRFDAVSSGFSLAPARATASSLRISIDPASVDTGGQAFDTRIAARLFEAGKYPSITFTSSLITIKADRFSVDDVLDFHGVKKPVSLDLVDRGFTHGRMGFSGETTFKRSEFGVGEWVPLEADEATLPIETEFVKT